jgi:hypothetical protein
MNIKDFQFIKLGAILAGGCFDLNLGICQMGIADGIWPVVAPITIRVRRCLLEY